MSSTYWEERIAIVKALITAYDAAFLAMANGQANYQLDTGQSRVLVTRHNIASLRLVRDSLSNELVTLEARVYGCGVTRIIPSF
jgi:hypothetical protein